MKQLIENVVQWGKDRGLDKVGHLAQAKYTLKETAELLDAYADGDQDKMNDAIGDILVTLIVGASNDGYMISVFSDILTDEKYNSIAKCNEVFNFFSDYNHLVKQISYLFVNSKLNRVNDVYYENCTISLLATLEIINCEFNQSLSLKDCLQLAYNEIKERTGKLVDGQFIKD